MCVYGTVQRFVYVSCKIAARLRTKWGPANETVRIPCAAPPPLRNPLLMLAFLFFHLYLCLRLFYLFASNLVWAIHLGNQLSLRTPSQSYI